MLQKIPNRQITYYKITNKEENHNGLQYHNGLIVDPKKFNDNPKEACIDGGIYFTTKELIHEFFYCGCWIRPVEIPLDAKVVLDPQGDRYRADKLLFKTRQSFDFYFDKLFDKKTFLKEGYKVLLLQQKDYFNRWFDRDYFNYKEYSWMLPMFYRKQFKNWYDKKKYNHKQDGWALAKFCSNKFYEWFDKDVFNYYNYSWILSRHCSKYYKDWFDKDYYNYKNSYDLLNYNLKYFDDWFDKELFNYEDHSWALAFFCPEKFNIWHDETKYNYNKDDWALDRFCLKYIKGE